MKGDIYLSAKEARRVYVIEQLIAGKLTVPEAARVLDLSERQVQRLKGGVMQYGVGYLAHKNRGKKPQHAVPESIRERIANLASDAYRETSCEHMAELLAEHQGIHVSGKTVARILKAAGIPLRHSHKSARKRRSRDRMSQAGLLVQVDASPYRWLEDRGPALHLHGAIDDATGQILGLHFGLQEETAGYLHVLAQMLDHYGVPQSLYSDRHTIFFSPQEGKLTVEEELAGKQVNLTQFGRALHDLGIQHIPARSPQAKGRVERLWRTLQSRLLVELRIAGVASLEDANAVLPAFRLRFNDRFAVEPAESTSAFRARPNAEAMQRVLAFHEQRKASTGSTISYKNVTYQLVMPNGDVVALKNRTPVTVVTHLDGSLSALYNARAFALKAVAKPPRTTSIAAMHRTRRHTPTMPAEDHPWRKPFKRPKGGHVGPVERGVEAELYDDFWEQVYAQR